MSVSPLTIGGRPTRQFTGRVRRAAASLLAATMVEFAVGGTPSNPVLRDLVPGR